MSALPPKADIRTDLRNVRLVPKADIDGSKSVALAVLYENDHLMPIPYGSGQQCALRALQLVHPSLRAINNKGAAYRGGAQRRSRSKETLMKVLFAAATLAAMAALSLSSQCQVNTLVSAPIET
jgi:hypothetical protein